MAKIRRLVLDVVVPSVTEVIKLVQDLAELPNIDGANSFVNEIDKNVINLKIIIEGSDVSFKKVEDVIHDHGGSVHSVDNIAAGKAIVQDVKTPQD
jgi:hypothetical protein